MDKQTNPEAKTKIISSRERGQREQRSLSDIEETMRQRDRKSGIKDRQTYRQNDPEAETMIVGMTDWNLMENLIVGFSI